MWGVLEGGEMTQLQKDIDELRDKTDPQSREECSRLRNVQRAEEATWPELLQWPTVRMQEE